MDSFVLQMSKMGGACVLYVFTDTPVLGGYLSPRPLSALTNVITFEVSFLASLDFESTTKLWAL